MNDYPVQAAHLIETMEPDDAAACLDHLPAKGLITLWNAIPAGFAASVYPALPLTARQTLIAELDRSRAAELLALLEPQDRDAALAAAGARTAQELRDLLSYPDDSAGRVMDTRDVRRSRSPDGAAGHRHAGAPHEDRSLFHQDRRCRQPADRTGRPARPRLRRSADARCRTSPRRFRRWSIRSTRAKNSRTRSPNSACGKCRWWISTAGWSASSGTTAWSACCATRQPSTSRPWSAPARTSARCRQAGWRCASACRGCRSIC